MKYLRHAFACCAAGAALIALPACTAPAPSGPPPAPGPGGACNDAPAQFAVGQAWGEALSDEVRRRSGSRLVRVVRPGMAITMEYNSERVTVELDSGNRVVRVRCG